MANSLAFWIENLKLPPQCKSDIPDQGSEHDDKSKMDTSFGSISGTDGSIKKSNQALPNVELHFNYWHLNAESTSWFKRYISNRYLSISYLDIGVRLKELDDFGSVNIYVPFKFSNIKYRPELGERICKDQELVAAVFNTPVIATRTNPSEMTYCDFEFFNKTEKIRFHTNISKKQHGMSSGVEITECDDGGAVLKFPRNIFFLEDGVDIYFRFRLELQPSEIRSISRIYKPALWALTNGLDKTELVDFRVNEIRNLPKIISNNIVSNSFISKVHLFLIRDYKSEFKASHDSFNRCRILESKIWDKYLGLDGYVIKDEMLIYHWKDGASESNKYLDHFSAFAKYSKRDISFFEFMLLLIILIGGVGGCSGWFGNQLWAWTHPEAPQANEELSQQSSPKSSATHSLSSKEAVKIQEGIK